MNLKFLEESFKKGGSIHIKKKNRGKFTDYCEGKVTLSCINKAKESNNPKLRKRAIFAENAKKWKHLNGGVILNPFNYFLDIHKVDTRKFLEGGNIYAEYKALETDNKKNPYEWASRNPFDYTYRVTMPFFNKSELTLPEETTPIEEEPFELTYVDYNPIVRKKEQQLELKKEEEKKSEGRILFDRFYDEFEKNNPEAKKYRKVLTKLALAESTFDSYGLNKAGAPAYGYFLMFEDGKNLNNITRYAGTDIETFRNNPMLQLEAALRLAKDLEKGFSLKDLEKAKLLGYSMNSLLAGAWLGGNKGVRAFLNGAGNPSDRKWSKSGKGTDVGTRMKQFNF